jgi:TPR repeat protein
VEVLETAAAGGDSWAKRDLARLLAEGEIVPGDPVRSAMLSREAAAEGNPYALRDHARNLESGYGQSADWSAAFAAMRAAATAGNAWAALDLARYYRDGVGTTVEPAWEAYWLARAAGRDDPSAASAAYELLSGLPRDALMQAIGAILEEQGEIPPQSGDQLGPQALAELGIAAGSDAELVAALLRLAR